MYQWPAAGSRSRPATSCLERYLHGRSRPFAAKVSGFSASEVAPWRRTGVRSPIMRPIAHDAAVGRCGPVMCGPRRQRTPPMRRDRCGPPAAAAPVPAHRPGGSARRRRASVTAPEPPTSAAMHDHTPNADRSFVRSFKPLNQARANRAPPAALPAPSGTWPRPAPGRDAPPRACSAASHRHALPPGSV